MENTLAVILAGGRGERLSVLAQERTKPAIPFAGKYRIIDFTLSNCVNSGVSKVAVLTQYQPLSLVDHLGVGAPWGLAAPGRAIRLLQPFLSPEEHRNWYKGTADAVFQNLQYIERQKAEHVLILSGDHVYKMDYSLMLNFHNDNQADVTLAYTRIPEADLSQFGTVSVDDKGQVTSFEEKVKHPKSNLISMGVYLFKKDVLLRRLEEDARLRSSKHDFGHDVLPRVMKKQRLFGYEFQGYWRDVGTVQTYWQTNMDLIHMSPGGYLSEADWPIRTNDEERSPAIVSESARVIDSLVSNGCLIEGHVEHSILSPGVIISEGAVVKDSIILSDSTVGSHSIIDCTILDKEVVVEAGCHIGFGDDMRVNRKEPKVLNTGITLVGKWAKIPPGTRIGHNCIIYCGVVEEDFRSDEIPSGQTVSPRKRRSVRTH
ncbi:MAG: glucose-1-phosphate adenylyltransferase subunit GlgD [Dehalococcoidales bacterium]